MTRIDNEAAAAAILFPPYAWYLFIEQVMKAIGWA